MFVKQNIYLIADKTACILKACENSNNESDFGYNNYWQKWLCKYFQKNVRDGLHSNNNNNLSDEFLTQQQIKSVTVQNDGTSNMFYYNGESTGVASGM